MGVHRKATFRPLCGINVKLRNKPKLSGRFKWAAQALFDVLIYCTFAPLLFHVSTETWMHVHLKGCACLWLHVAVSVCMYCVILCGAHQSIKYEKCNLLPCRGCFIIHWHISINHSFTWSMAHALPSSLNIAVQNIVDGKDLFLLHCSLL